MKPSWNPLARDRLADIYVTLDLDGQRALADAVRDIDAQLSADPWSCGESRANALVRLWYTEWLQVLLELTPGGGVEILRVSDNRPGRRRR